MRLCGFLGTDGSPPLQHSVELNVGDDVREHVTNRRAEQRQNDDYDDGHQNENQRVLYQALPFFAGNEQHFRFHLLLFVVCG